MRARLRFGTTPRSSLRFEDLRRGFFAVGALSLKRHGGGDEEI
jgi:hypothetical protein